MKHISSALLFSTLAGLSLGVAPVAHAQTTARFATVEFKDTTLADALEMIFQAANNPAHTIDPSASEVPIGSITLQNIQWDSALRTLANQNNFKVSRGADGSYLVEPREPVLQDGMGGTDGGSDPRSRGRFNGGSSSSAPGSVPGNPFVGNRPSTRPRVNFELLPSVRASAQTTPRVGGGTTREENSPPPPVPIRVRHIYAGGLAQLFGGTVIPTLPFVSPGSGGGGQGGGGGFGGQQGGFGGQQGGFGGQQGGFGGGFGGQQGGFGGQQGGFGGGFGGQQGGFGGQQGGFGGGFGGQQGGFGGQQGGFGGGFGGQQGGFGGQSGGFGF